MNAHHITSQDVWNELSKELMECALHATNIALSGMRGFSQRGLRCLKMAENNNLARIELLKSEPDLQSLVDQETDILQRNQDELLEDTRNLMQVSMFTHSEMSYWCQRIFDILLETENKAEK